MSELPFPTLLRPSAATGASIYLPVVRGGSVRSLLPADSPQVLRAVLARSNAPERLPRHLARRVYAGVAGVRVATGRGRPSGLVGLDDHELRELLGWLLGRPVRLAVHFGPPRANRKPVVHVLDDDGQLVAVAKIAVDALTESLVHAEAGALQALSRRTLSPALVVPRLLALTTWVDQPLLLQSPIGPGHRHTCPAIEHRSAAERALVAAVPASPGRAETYLLGLRDRVLACADVPAREQLLRALDAAGHRLEAGLVETGAWHGDWSAQNLAATATGVAAWDWERFDTDRPLGFDAAHFQLRRLLGTRRTEPGVKLLARAPAVFRCWQSLPGPEQAHALALILLVELGARYAGDGQSRSGALGARVADWVSPALQWFEARTLQPKGLDR